MADRSAEDIASGILRITIGGVETEVPTLSIRRTREWQRLVSEKLGAFGALMSVEQSPDSLTRFASLSLDTILDLVTAYDDTGRLGTRDEIEERADPSQLYEALRRMGSVAFPFVGDLRTMLLLMPGVLAPRAPSPSESSTNGRSRSGGSTRATSRTGSTRSS